MKTFVQKSFAELFDEQGNYIPDGRYREILRLDALLAAQGVPHTCLRFLDGWQVCLPGPGLACRMDAIEHFGSYGAGGGPAGAAGSGRDGGAGRVPHRGGGLRAHGGALGGHAARRRKGGGAVTREEALMLSAYTGVLLVPDFEDVHRYCEELMGFPILTHEFAGERLQSEIREKLRPRVWALCQAAADNPSGGREQADGKEGQP